MSISSFTMYCNCSGEVKTFISFCSKFVQETVYHISSVSFEFYRRYYKRNILVSNFLDTVYIDA